MGTTGKVLLSIVLSALVTGGLVGGVWYYQSQQTSNDMAELEDQVEDLQGQMVELEDESVNSKPSSLPVNENLITYDLGTAPITVTSSQVPVSSLFTASQLTSNSSECGTNNNSAYYTNLLRDYAGEMATQYVFTYNLESQDDGTYTLTVIPNHPEYAALDEFKNDFDVCSVGADHYPSRYSESYLLFASSCGSGFDDGSGLPHGCDEIVDALGTSIRLIDN